MNRVPLNVLTDRSVRLTLVLLAVLGAGASSLTSAEMPHIDRAGTITFQNDEIVGMGWLAKERSLAIAHADGKIDWWTITGKPVGAPWTVEGGIAAIAVSRDGAWVYVARNDPQVDVMDRRSQKVLWSIKPKGRSVALTLSSDSKQVMTYSPGRQVFNLEGTQLAIHGGVSAELGTMGFLNEDRDIADFSKKLGRSGGWVFGKSANSGRVSDVASFQAAPNGIGLYDASLSGDRRMAVAAGEGGVLIPITQFKKIVRAHTVIPNFGGEFRVVASQHGRFAICLKPNGDATAGRGLIWDMVVNRQVAELSQVPPQIGEIAFHPDEQLLAIRDPKGSIGLWNLSSVLKGDAPSETYLNGQVNVALESRKTDSEAPVQHKDWYLERWGNPQAPGYMKGAWKFSPVQPDAKVGLVETREEGAFFYAVPNPVEATADQRLDHLQERMLMRTIDQWIDLGPCPWNLQARLYFKPQPRGDVDLYGIDKIEKNAEFLFVPGKAYQSNEFLKLFPPKVQHALTVAKVTDWFNRKEYQLIEELAHESRKTKASFGWGWPVLGAVYQGLDCPPKFDRDRHDAKLREYYEAKRNTLTAQIVFARHMLARAYEIRGTDIFANIPKGNREAYLGQLKTIRNFLEPAVSVATNDPYLEMILPLTNSQGSASVETNIDTVIRGLKKNADCVPLVQLYANWTLERWSGEPKAGLQLVHRLKQEFPGDQGRALAAIAAMRMFESEPDRWGDVLGFQIKDFQEDLTSLNKLSPDDPRWKLVACRLSVLHTARSEAKALWQTLEATLDPDYIGSFSHFAEWTDQIEGRMSPGLVWSELGDLGGQVAISSDGTFRHDSNTYYRASGKLGMSPDGNLLLCLNPAGRMRLFNSQDGKLVGEDRGKFLTPLSAAIPAADHVVIAHETGVLHYQESKGISDVPYSRPIPLREARLSPDGKRLVIVDSLGSVQILDATTAKILTSFAKAVKLAEGIVVPVTISRDSQRAAVLTSDTTVDVYDLIKGKAVTKLKVPDSGASTLCFHSRGTRLAATGSRTVWEWNIATKIVTGMGNTPSMNSVALEVSEDGQHWALHSGQTRAHADADILIMERGAKTGKWRPIPELRSFSEMLWHPTEPRLAVYSASGIVSVWDARKVP